MQHKDTPTLQKRARRKLISASVAAHLLQANPDSHLCTGYERTRHCSEVIVQDGQTLTSSYCRHRWCAVCGAIRMGRTINGYETQLREFAEPYFVTLTKETVLIADLPASMEFMGKAWRKITNMARQKKFNRLNFRGVRKAENTIRPLDLYHYHYHLIIDGRGNAEWLVEQWLRLMGDKANRGGQDIRPADPRSFKELFKYATKLVASSKDNERGFLPFDRLDAVFQALEGKKTFQPFGGLRAVSEEVEELASEEFPDMANAQQVWLWDQCDWTNEVGDLLTGYQPSPEFARLFVPPATPT